MKIYAFDVDDTLAFAKGPILLSSLHDLKEEGHILGICGNWRELAKNFEDWHKLFSFLSPIPGTNTKPVWLRTIKAYIPADEYVLVGNILGVSGSSDDQTAAKQAGWRFIKESDFTDGER